MAKNENKTRKYCMGPHDSYMTPTTNLENLNIYLQ